MLLDRRRGRMGLTPKMCSPLWMPITAWSAASWNAIRALARHERAAGKYAEILVLDHYLEVLRRKPGGLPGDSGTGKTHLLIGLGLAACEQGRRVRYVTWAALVNELVEAADQRALSRLVGRYGRLDLLLLDELGYVQVDPRGAELLFQIITEREERAAVAIGTNLPFSKAHMFQRTCVRQGRSFTGS
jgi:DNA replication protein DnaC